jgi:hypothetical protein
MQIARPDAAQHAGRALEELHRCRRRTDGQLFGQAEQIAVRVAVDVRERFGRFGEEWVRMPP